MSTVVRYRKLCDSEVEEASDLARRVFDEFVAAQYSVEYQQEFHRYASPNAMRERHLADCITLAAERDGRLIGMLHLKRDEHIEMLFVESESQRQGIGRSLIGLATEYAITRQPPVRALTIVSAPNALEAYRKIGFVPVGAVQVVDGNRFIPMKLELAAARPQKGEVQVQPQGLAKALPLPDLRCFEAAQGWLELGSPSEASAEIEKISSCKQSHPDVLNLRWEICAALQNWEAALEIAATLIHLDAEEPLGWIHRSYALHELKRTAEARDNLLRVVDKFPGSATMCYNLACYECQLGRLEQAKNWLETAFRLGDARKMRLAALEDSDLKPLWRDIGST